MMETILHKTLALLELNRTNVSKKDIIAHCNTDQGRDHVHKKTNIILREIIEKNNLGTCIHITGEMSVLTDPFHRFLCEEISLKEKDVFRIVYSHPEEYLTSAVNMLQWNTKKWATKRTGKKWYEQLRTIYSIANRSVNLFSLANIDNKVHYSVFGNKYILIHGNRTDRNFSKHTWLLESEKLNAELSNKGEEFIRKSIDIDEGNYKRFTLNLSGVASKHILKKLSTQVYIEIEKIFDDQIANDFTDSVKDVVQSLSIMKFIEIDDKGLTKITDSGREFLE